MRIVFLSPYYFPRIGGVERHAQAVAETLVKKKHKVTVVTAAHASDLPHLEEINGVRIFRADATSAFSKPSMWSFIFKNWMTLQQADVIHVHDVIWWLAPFLPLLRGKVHLTHHGWEGKYPVPQKNKIQRALWARLAQTLTHVGDWIREFYWEKPDFVTYGGVSKPLSHTKVAVKKSDIIFLGRLEKENDIQLYLELATILKKKNPTLKITWVGDGAYRESCTKMGDVTGMVPDPALYIHSAKQVWSASYLSMLDAQAQGKLVCALWSHHLKQRYLETYPGFPWLVSGTSPKVVAQELEKLLRFPSLEKRLTQPAAEWAQSQTWEKIAGKYLSLWR